jgi:hypothetical protein
MDGVVSAECASAECAWGTGGPSWLERVHKETARVEEERARLCGVLRTEELLQRELTERALAIERRRLELARERASIEESLASIIRTTCTELAALGGGFGGAFGG